jgi:hypothetical protein
LLIQIDSFVEPGLDDGLAMRLSLRARGGIVDGKDLQRHGRVERYAEQTAQQEADRWPSRKG